MVDAGRRASSMIKTRQRQYDKDVAHAEGARPPTRSIVPDSPLIKNNIYKMDAWLQPFADVKTLHQQAMQENKERFQKYMDDLGRKLKREKQHQNTNELVKRIYSQKRHITDKLTAHSIALQKTTDPAELEDTTVHGKAKQEALPQKDLSLIFEGHTVMGDELRNYRLKKKIQHVSIQLQTMIKREKLSAGNNLAAINAANPNNPTAQPVKSVSLGTTLLMKNFDKIVSRFEEKDPVFHAVSRAKLDQMQMSLKDTPPPGCYNPKQYDSFLMRSYKGRSFRVQSQQSNSKPQSQRAESPMLSTQHRQRQGFLDITITTVGKRGEKKAIISGEGTTYPELNHSESILKRERQRSQMSMGGGTIMEEGGASPKVEQLMKRSIMSHQNMTSSSMKNPFASPGGFVQTQPKLVPNFEKQGDRHTIFSQPSRAKTIIGHFEGRPQVNDKRFESLSPHMQCDQQLSWTGSRPRRIALNINFTKPTNRDGAKIILVKPTQFYGGVRSAQFSPKASFRQQRTNSQVEVSSGHVVLIAKKANEKKKITQKALLGPCIYNPSFEGVEPKIGKNIQNWDLIRKTNSVATSPTGRRERMLEVMSREVKPPKKRITQEDIEKEDNDMIHTFIEKLGQGSTLVKGQSSSQDQVAIDSFLASPANDYNDSVKGSPSPRKSTFRVSSRDAKINQFESA